VKGRSDPGNPPSDSRQTVLCTWALKEFFILFWLFLDI
jgi:hypothetical protein